MGFSSDIDEEDVRRTFEDAKNMVPGPVKAVSEVGKGDDVKSSQASQENSTSKFHHILSAAIMDGLDSVDFSYVPYF